MIKKLIGTYRHLRAGGRESAKRFLSEYDHNHLHVISCKPPVVYMWWGRCDEALHEELRSKDLTILYLFPWCTTLADIPGIAEEVKARLKRFPNHRIVFLCNEQFTVEPLRALGIEALFVNQNAFINEDVFRPLEAVERTHDALYSASLAPYKRHALAMGVNSLILLSYSYSGTTSSDYEKDVRRDLDHAWWAKDSKKEAEKFPVEKIVELYNRAHVGLCLSAIEGSMFVSMEYLLSGLPVVSTKCVGGRDSFWSEGYTVIAEDNPASVARAVSELKERSLPRQFVRESALKLVTNHRERLAIFLRDVGVKLECPWKPGSHGTTTFASLRKVGKQIREGTPLSELP